MWIAAALMAAASGAGPNGLQVLHSNSAEQTHQQQMVQRLNGVDPLPAAARRGDPASPADKSSAAWRADHLTCASAKGRTRAQFAAECRPAPEPAPN